MIKDHLKEEALNIVALAKYLTKDEIGQLAQIYLNLKHPKARETRDILFHLLKFTDNTAEPEPLKIPNKSILLACAVRIGIQKCIKADIIKAIN